MIATCMKFVSSEEIIYLAIRTLLIADEPLPAATINEIDEAMTSLQTELSTIVDDVAAEVNTAPPPVRSLRGLTCSQCQGYPVWVLGCWVSATIWRPKCDRVLKEHKDLSDEEVAGLNEDDRRRHLQISALCSEAKAGVSNAITEAESSGSIPLPEGGSFIEQCLYEIE